MCRCLRLHTSGFYAWIKKLLCQRAQENERQTKLIKEVWKESGNIYGYRKLHDDLCDLGETCCPNRVARLARLAGIYAQIGYKRRPGKYGGKPSVVVDNTLDRQFYIEAPNSVWVTDITYIRTHEGFSYLAVVIDLFSRRVVGWSMQNRRPTDLVSQALFMSVWRRKPTSKILVHSDQGSQVLIGRHSSDTTIWNTIRAAVEIAMIMQWQGASSTCLNVNASGAEHTKPEKTQDLTCSIK